MPTLLIVEDHPIVREPLSKLLRSEGFDVLTASNGGEALGLLYEHPIDLILLDVLMPRMHGVAFMEALRQDARFSQLSTIGLTGSFDPTQLARLRELGVETILSKGKFELSQLLNAIRAVLPHPTGGDFDASAGQSVGPC